MNLYTKLIGAAKEVLEATQIPFRVARAEKDLEMEILKIQQEVAEGDVYINEEKSKYPTNWGEIIKKIDKKELLERKLKQLQNLQVELFQTEVTK